jgi:hypothetical protein
MTAAAAANNDDHDRTLLMCLVCWVVGGANGKCFFGKNDSF